MISPSAAALRFSRAFTFAVVDNTAVATFVTVSFFGGLVGEGYAKILGLTFDTKSNLGIYHKSWLRMVVYAWITDLKVSI